MSNLINRPYENSPEDPWKKKKDVGPPDLMDIFKNFSKKFSNEKGGSGGDSKPPFNQKTFLTFFSGGLLLILLIWAASGFYIVQPAEQAAITRFGKFIKVEGSGLHWIPRFIESYNIQNVQFIESFDTGGVMLTQDENLVSVDLNVQYKIGDIQKFLFNTVTPIDSLTEATESALRQAIGNNMLDNILTVGRDKLTQEITQIVENTINSYDLGLTLVKVNLQSTAPPDRVKGAFDDVIKAREELISATNIAKAFSNRVIAEARGQSDRIIAEAEGYKDSKILDAKGNTARFAEVLPEYLKAPAVTKTRLYLETMEQVLGGDTRKIIVDSNGGSNVFYIPVDQMPKTINNPNVISNSNTSNNSSINSQNDAVTTASSDYDSKSREYMSRFRRS